VHKPSGLCTTHHITIERSVLSAWIDSQAKSCRKLPCPLDVCAATKHGDIKGESPGKIQPNATGGLEAVSRIPATSPEMKADILNPHGK